MLPLALLGQWDTDGLLALHISPVDLLSIVDFLLEGTNVQTLLVKLLFRLADDGDGFLSGGLFRKTTSTHGDGVDSDTDLLVVLGVLQGLLFVDDWSSLEGHLLLVSVLFVLLVLVVLASSAVFPGFGGRGFVGGFLRGFNSEKSVEPVGVAFAVLGFLALVLVVAFVVAGWAFELDGSRFCRIGPIAGSVLGTRSLSYRKFLPRYLVRDGVGPFVVGPPGS